MLGSNWTRIILFLCIAITISNIFRFDVFELKPILETLPTWLFVLLSVLLEGSVVFIGALLARHYLIKNRNVTITFFGTSKKWSLLMAIIPVVLVVGMGV